MTRLALLAAFALATAAFAQPDGGVRKPVVAVVYFEVDDRLGELTVFRKGLAEMLITDLVASDRLTVVERARLEEVTKELDLKDSKYFKNGKAIEIGDLLQAQWKITGMILPVKQGLIIEARLIRMLTAQIVKTARVVIAREDVLEGELKLVEKLITAIAEAEKLDLPVPQRSAVKLKLDTAVKYSQSLEARDSKDKAKAKLLLDQVVKEQPDFILARLDLAALAK